VAQIELKDVTKRFGQTVAVNRLSLQVEAGAFLTLLGPSGCGKTTVLRMIAGLEVPDQGEIRINNKTVFSSAEGIFVAPAKRGVGLVFQSYALWPHMTVFGNVAFGLQIHGTGKQDIENRVKTALAYMQLQGMERRYPQEMSGGQQQRVALARMLVTQPSIFLMDEPLSNLDAKLRMEMRGEIKRIHWESKATTVYVTHDQTEALTLSTNVAVMNHGVLQQLAPPQHLYRRPANLFVADFIGSPTINLIPGEIVQEGDSPLFKGDGLTFRFPPLKPFAGKKVIAALRPENITLSREQREPCVKGEVYSVLPAGAEVIVQVKSEETLFSVREMGDVSLEAGDLVFLRPAIESMIFYNREDGTLLYPADEP
jgi:multiple sugar transport system ATP-binding protein